jgi:Protein of unknown function (DUF3006)
MGISLCLDRFEGAEKQLAVLVTDDGLEVVMPRALLPAGTAPGSIITCTLEHNKEATHQLASDLKDVQAELRKTDPGGDIHL